MRRCGWFDAVIARYSARINGISSWALTKLDVLSHFDTLNICVAYEYKGNRIEDFPADLRMVNEVKPIYEELPGWNEDISAIREVSKLPDAAINYIHRIQELTDTPLEIISVGSERSQTIRVS